MDYDVLIVGAGLYGAVLARRALDAGKRVLVLEKRGHIGGNAYTEARGGIHVHRYGAHIFHTNDERVWRFVTSYVPFNRFTNAPIANYHGEIYSLPFNMYTFNRIWGVTTPDEAAAKIEAERAEAGITEPQNLEEQAISLVGRTIYEKLVRGYTEKQWGRPCTELPAFIIRRLPVRLTYDNNYFNARHQGIPIGGYTKLAAALLEGADVLTDTDYLADRARWNAKAERVIYSGAIDAYYDYRFGALEYRTLRFETEALDTPNYQGNAVVNYTDRETPYTRVIEHKWFDPADQPTTVITREYSAAWQPGDEPFYPINDVRNSALYAKYRALADAEENVIIGGRLGSYRYYDMDQVIAEALALADRIF